MRLWHAGNGEKVAGLARDEPEEERCQDLDWELDGMT